MNSFVAVALATAVLVMIPGPNVALIIANSLRFGLRSGLATVAGTTLGVAVQLALVVAGVSAVVALAAETLAWIRWAGVAYLVWLGLRTWSTPAAGTPRDARRPTVFWHGGLIAALNPKTLLFNAAFLPQFVHADSGVAAMATVAGIFLGVVLLGDTLWAVFASSARPVLARLRNRIAGGFLVLAGLGLGAAGGRLSNPGP